MVRKLEKRLDCFGDLVDHVQCTKCKKWLPANKEFFYRQKDSPFGIQSWCKDCREEHKRKRKREGGIQDWFALKASHARYRAKQIKHDYNLKFEDLEFPTHCPVSGMELDYCLCTKGDGKKRLNGASLDRIDSSLGYVRGNVRIISWLANYWKSNLEEKEFFFYIQQFYFHMFATMGTEASMAESVDAPDLKSVDPRSWEFKSPCSHHTFNQ